MSTQFPSSIISFSTKSNGQVIDANDINSPQNEITALETKVGTDGSADTTTLDYIVKNASSNGGGHVQTANKGGTGQTSYTKGDLLVASSTSVLGKLSVSSVAGDVLVADPNQTSGMKWAPVVANKITINTSSVAAITPGSSVLATIFSASILGSTLGTNNAIKFTGVLTDFSCPGPNANPIFSLMYGNNTIATTTLNPISSVKSLQGTIEGNIVSNGVSSQIGYFRMMAFSNALGNGAGGLNQGLNYVHGFGRGTSSINSTTDQNIIIKATLPDNFVGSVVGGTFVVEKIV